MFWRVLLCVNLKNMEHLEHSEQIVAKCLFLLMFHVCSKLSVLMEHLEHSEQNAVLDVRERHEACVRAMCHEACCMVEVVGSRLAAGVGGTT